MWKSLLAKDYGQIRFLLCKGTYELFSCILNNDKNNFALKYFEKKYNRSLCQGKITHMSQNIGQ